ncbi:hypothetical protein GMAR_ORF24 [Golden Marseillevirus]|uniref:hypothetical protein n=1 Tax=Golden Marseillevirus TaxID=1720526 RepID=UPI000877A9AE|nr:hypothetical protein GMAR_ORF24 [Golden Marseillevirus]ALX27399.1 hypothetical protein GMAR_ORF24 [Golden Marseillevirus]
MEIWQTCYTNIKKSRTDLLMNTPKYFPDSHCQKMRQRIVELEKRPQKDLFQWNFRLFIFDELSRLNLKRRYERDCLEN